MKWMNEKGQNFNNLITFYPDLLQNVSDSSVAHSPSSH